MRAIMKSAVWLMLIVPTIVLAQDPSGLSDDLSKERREKIKAFKIGYLTEKLSLTPAEATAFWPVYNEFQEKKQKLRKEGKGVKKQRENIEGLSDAEIEKIVDEKMKRKERMLVLEKEFHVKVKGILPIKKVYLLGKAERDFKRVMMKRMQKRKKGKMGSN